MINRDENASVLRDSGLSIVGQVPWGTHFCQFYQSQKDLLDILVPYFKAGLRSGEFCVWVTSDFLTEEEARKAMEQKVPSFAKYLKSGQIEIFPYTNWYLKEGKFELKRVLNKWLGKHEESLKKGFKGLRVSGNPFWIDNKKDWDDFAAYEAEINNVIGPYNLLVLCTYSVDKCKADEVIDVVTNHDFALIKRAGKWELIESAEQKKIKVALLESEKKYASLFANMLDGFAYCKMIFSKKGKPVDFVYLEINKSFERLTGLKREVVIGRRVTEAIPGIWKTNPELFKIYGKVAISCKEEHLEVFFKPLNKWLSIAVYCPKKGYFVAVFDDITKRKEAEEREKNFFTMVGHELRNSLTPTVLSLDLLEKKSGNGFGGNQSLQMIKRQTENMSNLVKDLLVLSSISKGKIKLKMERIRLPVLFANVEQTIRPIIREAEQRLSISMPRKKITFEADPLRIEQILINLLGNASKYTKAGGQIRLRAWLEKDFLNISVKDNGRGISKKELPNIFDLFVQSGANNRRTDGLGIGLYISRQFAKLHGGDILVSSKGLSKGSEFTLKIPVGKDK